MAGALNKIDSNVSGLRYAEEECIGKLQEEAPAGPGASVWKALEPNTYADFGGQNVLSARRPINDSRQASKGVVVDLDASGGFNQDLTQTNAQDLLQGFMFADFRPKDEFGGAGEITGVTTGPDTYTAASGLDAFAVGDLINTSGFTNAANNGLHEVTAVSATVLTVAETLVPETPGAGAKIVTVGFIGAADDIDVDATGSLPILSSTILDFTTLGLTPGETIFIGGDAAIEAYDTAANNGFKRIRSITANTLTLDKSDVTMVTEVSAGSKTIQLFFGRVLKNELSADIVRRSYNLERTLGAPDPDQPSEIQAEYLEGAVGSEFTLNAPTAEKLTVDMSFVATDHTNIDGPTSLKAGTRPVLQGTDAFNTSSDFARAKLAIVTPGVEAPASLVGFLTDLTLTINNNLTANKAIATTGAFDITAGLFGVAGSVTAYFSSVSAVEAVRANSGVTLDFALVKDNKGIVIDVPLIALGDARLSVEIDQPITMPLTIEAARGGSIDTALDHTLMFVFFDYLPDAA